MVGDSNGLLGLQSNIGRPTENAIDIIIDGNNVAFDNVPKGQPPRFRNLELSLMYYVKKNLHVRVVVDASLRHEIDDKKVFNQALDQKFITQSPAGVQADEYILKLALVHPQSKIVSNDNFENWRNRDDHEYEEIKKDVLSRRDRFIKFKINGEFIEFK